jgi:hypothetical protein
MGDLNANLGFPHNEWEEVIVNLLDELCLVDLLHGFWLQTPRRTATRARWMGSQQRGTRRHYLQPDYILAQAGETRKFRGMGFHFLFFFHSNNRTVVAVVRAGGEGRLKTNWQKRQKFPLSLPLGPKDKDTAAFDALTAECINPKLTWKPGKDWMSKATWRLIAKRASLLQSGRIRQDAAWRMKPKIKASIKADKQKLTGKVGSLIVIKLVKGDIKEAFRHLKGWYREAAKMQARPC